MPEIDFQNLHHAYLLIGSADEARSVVEGLFSSNNVNLKSSPDFFVFNAPLLGIDEARKISAQAIRRAFTERKVFLFTPERITAEAQNALLKTFEEPIERTHFFLVAREENLILPTLRSRLEVVRLGALAEASEAERFLKLSLKERLNFVKKFVDGEQNLPVFLDRLLLALKGGTSREKLEAVYRTRLYADDRSASARLILEHLAVIL